MRYNVALWQELLENAYGTAGVGVPLPVLISPGVTCPEQQRELAEPVQGLTQGAGLVHGWTGSQ